MKQFTETVAKAKRDAARLMTRQLRQHAADSGWDAEVVSNMHVVHEDNKFVTKIHPNYVERATTLEYGTETQRPKAAIRKFLNDGVMADRIISATLDHHWKGRK